MKISKAVRDSYTTPDPEADLFLDFFDEEPGTSVLEVGAHDAPLASMLMRSGFYVTSVDLRPTDGPQDHPHIVGDFCNLDINLLPRPDCVFSVSAIEHFGLGGYGDARKAYYDVIAMRRIWELLNLRGVCYLTVPFGGKYVEVQPHWRCYDWGSMAERLIQDFKLEGFLLRVVQGHEMNGVQRRVGDDVSMMDVMNNLSGTPFISALLKLRK